MTDQEIIIRLVDYINRMVEGDDVFPELEQDMQRWGFWDQNGFPIYGDDSNNDDDDDDQPFGSPLLINLAGNNHD